MSDICSGHHLNDLPHQPVARCAAGWLAFAAAPVFAIMALLTHFAGGDMLCAAVPGASALTGMTTMYALMCAFHLSPWLRLIGSSHDDTALRFGHPQLAAAEAPLSKRRGRVRAPEKRG